MAKKKTKKSNKGTSCCSDFGDFKGGCLYGLGIFGAAVFYISNATGFWNGCWGLIKAFLWPAFLVYEVLKYIGA